MTPHAPPPPPRPTGNPHGTPDRFPAARLDPKSVTRAAVAAGLSLAALLGGAEAGLRAVGWPPSVEDGDALRGAALHRAVTAGPGVVALTGSSRMQLGFDAATFHARYPGRPLVNLSVDGGCGVGFLDRLAADDRFRGTAVVDLSELHMDEDFVGPARDTARRAAAAKPLDRRAAGAVAALQTRCVLAGDLRVRWKTLTAVLSGRRPAKPLFVRDADRYVAADYRGEGVATGQLEDVRAIARRRAERRGPAEPDDPAAWLRRFRRLRPCVDAIEARGGRVAFVRFPTTGEQWAEDEARHPRTLCWDRLAEALGAPTVHFRDLPTADLVCPDGSHLDRRDRPAFTAALLDALAERGVLGT